MMSRLAVFFTRNACGFTQVVTSGQAIYDRQAMMDRLVIITRQTILTRQATVDRQAVVLARSPSGRDCPVNQGNFGAILASHIS